MKDLSDRLAALSPEQRALFELKLKRKGLDPVKTQPIPRRSQANFCPLSFGQQRLWFLDQLTPGSWAYNISTSVLLSGALDLAALQRSLDEIVRRHEMLRTTFAVMDGQPVQVIVPVEAMRLPLPIEDLSHLPERDWERTARDVATAKAQQPFDLSKGPLLRTTVLRMAPDTHILLVTMHHIVTDRWSFSLFEQELALLYAAFVAGRPSPLPELPIQYADYAIWQREWLRGELLDAQLAYWRRQLAGIEDIPGLATDHPRPALQTFNGAHHYTPLPGPVSDALRELSQQEGATLFMTTLAAFDVLLSRYTGHDEVVVGSPIANRNRTEVEPLIGFFINNLVLRTDLSGNPTFRALLGRVREMARGAYAHQDLPFERLVDELGAERDLSRTSVFRVSFLFLDFEEPLPPLPGLSVRHLDVDAKSAKFDLTLSLWDEPDHIYGLFEYNTDLFEPATIAAMAQHFQTLLAGIAATPDRRLAELSLLTETERHQILVEWSAPAASPQPSAISHQELAADACLHTLFEAQAARTPDAVALVFEPTTDDRRPTTDDRRPPSRAASAFSLQMTYAELDRRANQLGHYLRSRGVGPETIVALCLERSLELVVAMFGALKAGGAYLPLDPDYPAERLAFMLEDSRAAALITMTDDRRPTTDDQVRPVVGGRWSSVETVDLARDWPIIARQPTHAPDVTVAPENLAYLIYTSGSTGRPKGVAVPHAGIGPLAHAQIEAFGLGVGSRALQFTSVSFDGAVSDYVTTLLSGATLVLAPQQRAQLGAGLLALLRRQAVTSMKLPPALLAALPDAELPALRTVMAGGEACSAELVARWQPGRRFFNVYGPSEAIVCATLAECYADGLPPPIGRPIAGKRLYLLDAHLQPAPVGVSGEICIGVGLARGYLHRPELTAERFIPNPFGTMTDERRTMNEATLASSFCVQRSAFDSRLYRSGDLARWRPDGDIEFLGRVDQQIKLRGYRIELGEIEVVLGQHPAVARAVVLLREDAVGGKRLVAYIVTSDKLSVTSSEVSSLVTGNSSLAAELRTFLATRLPEYMVPSAFVLLERLPLSPNGKLDRRALPAPEASGAEPGGSFVAPRTPDEALVARICAELLGVARVGLDDSFFELGGHSLLATQLVSRLRDAFNLELPLHRVFEEPTVAGLTRSIDTIRWAAQPQAARGAEEEREEGLL